MRASLDEAADVVDDLVVGGAAASLADDLAEGLAGRFSVIYGSAGPALPAAIRWKTQFNENAKAAAAWGIIPELDHNEIVGWDADPDLSRRRVGVVSLRDEDEHPRWLDASRSPAGCAPTVSDGLERCGHRAALRWPVASASSRSATWSRSVWLNAPGWIRWTSPFSTNSKEMAG